MPMVLGIVLFALGMKQTLGHVDEPLGIIPAIGLCGGLALYMAAHVAVRLRISGSWGHGRPTATVALLALIPVATMVPSLAALALVAAVCAMLIAYEAIRYRYARSWIRSHRGEFTMEEASRIAPHTGGAPIEPES
jgi:low temperature requirement protein LtrA